jgi:hypothetical protein
MSRWPLTLGLALLLAGCATAPERPETLRQALVGLGERAVARLTETGGLPSPRNEQVLLLGMPEVEATLGVEGERLLESLSRALLGLPDSPQVLDWRAGMANGVGDNQWRLETRLTAEGEPLSLSDRRLLPYRLTLRLSRQGDREALWEEEILGAFDATAL